MSINTLYKGFYDYPADCKKRIFAKKMEVIFALHFLKVIGFGKEEINSVIENCYPLKQKLGKT